MITPGFWKVKGLLSTLLLPFGYVYAAGTALKLKASKPFKAPCPVICIGNVTAGGTGKTPVSLSIAELVKNSGKNPFFISRGYGGTLKNIIVNKSVHSPQQAGDEPLLLTETAPVAINPDRAEAARLAIANGADCLIMDDGFQNPGLHKDLSFLVFNGAYGIGNGRVIPSGPLRESFAAGIKRAQAVIIIGQDKTGIARQTTLPVFYGHIKEIQPEASQRAAFAFAGIGDPQKFYNSLQNCGIKIAQTQDFPDHHFYTSTELQHIIDFARKNNLDIYTTAKDFVKIPLKLQPAFKVLRIMIEWEEPEKLQHFIKSFIAKP